MTIRNESLTIGSRNFSEFIENSWKFEILKYAGYKHCKSWRLRLYMEDPESTKSSEEVIGIVKDLLNKTVGSPNNSYISRASYTGLWFKSSDTPYILGVSTDEIKRVHSIDVHGLESVQNPKEKTVKNVLLESGLFTEKWEQPEVTHVYYAFPGPDGEVDMRRRSFAEEPFDEIKGNYTPEVQEQVVSLLERIREVENGLIILHGAPGTGKTHLIRALLTELRKERLPVVCVPPITFLTSISLLTNAVSFEESSLVVFEDLGEVVRADSSSMDSNVFSNLLNVTDGLLSLLNDSVTLLSFNTDIDKIDPALLRPGRCIGKIEVGPLPFEQADKLLREDGLELDLAERKYTLAEVYEMKRLRGIMGKSAPRPKEPMGFAARTSRRSRRVVKSQMNYDMADREFDDYE